MQLPPKLISSLEKIESFEKDAFEAVHESGEKVTSARFNPSKYFQKANEKYRLNNKEFQLSPVPWSQFGFYLSERPSFTFDPLFHCGCYYVQEASSMFLEQAFKQTLDLSRPLKVLDLCAAPGGKSTHIQSLISQDSLLVSNEVNRSRANTLKDNIIKWGCDNVIVTNNDPRDFSGLENYFDVIVVDAPCSGSGLIRRDPDALEEWSENNVQLCSQRQQRILANIIPALKNSGILVYSTCSYSREEDEEMTQWLVKEFPMTYLPLKIPTEWGIAENEQGYRFWPYNLKGEGLYLSCFRKTAGSHDGQLISKTNAGKLNLKEMQEAGKWVRQQEAVFFTNENKVYLWPEKIAADFKFILEQFRVLYSGVYTGEVFPGKFIPSHALAMSKHIGEHIEKLDLEYEEAIRYLQRKAPELDVKSKGWQLVTYEKLVLGWVNVLTGRINNYYPKELRIIKDN